MNTLSLLCQTDHEPCAHNLKEWSSETRVGDPQVHVCVTRLGEGELLCVLLGVAG